MENLANKTYRELVDESTAASRKRQELDLEIRNRIGTARHLLEECLGGKEYTRIWYFETAADHYTLGYITYRYSRESGYETYRDDHKVPLSIFNSAESISAYFADKKKEAEKNREALKVLEAKEKAEKEFKKAQDEYNALICKFPDLEKGTAR